jgi:ribosomal protein S18 acetylase RimI-like enzyme
MIFREAVASDAEALAELIYLADQSQYATSGYATTIGGTRQRQIAVLAKLAKAEAKSQFHYSHFDVAEEESEGKVAACVAGFDRSLADAQINPALIEIGWTAEEIEALIERVGELANCLPQDPPGTWTIEHVATLPRFRGRGLATHLLKRALSRGAQRGYERAVVDVFAGNTAARAVYERAGFEFQRQFGHQPLREILDRDPLERFATVL